MNTIKHNIRRHEALTEGGRYVAVTLPAVPGVTVDGDRSETEPHTRTIRAARPHRSPAGVALVAAAQRRVEWVRQALREVDRENGY